VTRPNLPQHNRDRGRSTAGARRASKTLKGCGHDFGDVGIDFTQAHVIISLIGIVTGFIVLFAMLGGKWLGGWNALVLLTTIAIGVTGFFPSSVFGAPHIVGVISLVVLTVALVALYGFGLGGA
jgi:hypothetical protein